MATTTIRTTATTTKINTLDYVKEAVKQRVTTKTYTSTSAPLRVPWQRRLQMLSVIMWLSLSLSMISFFLGLLSQAYLLPLLLLYMTYIVLDRAPEQGGRRIQWVRELPIWRYFSEYFPIQIIKEQDLDPKDNYVFGYHPHGILAFGAVSMFATEGSGFSKLFPGVTPRLMTLSTNFRLPIYRDILLSLGFCSASRSSCEYALKSGPGQSIGICIGGAEEAMLSSPGTNKLVLTKRLGFIRLAIRQQSSLVPVFSFGETDVYKQFVVPSGSFVNIIQRFVKKWLGVSAPLFYGRGIFNYDFGLIPFRKQVAIIVGRPISVPKLGKDQVEPTQEQILALQDLYIKELERIYHHYKDIYAKDRQQDLQIIA